MVTGPEWRATPVEWDLVYPTHSEPIGRIRAVRSGFRAQLGEEFLGEFPTGDAAAKAVWERVVTGPGRLERPRRVTGCDRSGPTSSSARSARRCR